MPGEGYSAVELGELAVRMTADIRNFQLNLKKAITLLRQFKNQSRAVGLSVSTHFENMGAEASEKIAKMNESIRSSSSVLTSLRKRVERLEEALKKASRSVKRTERELKGLGTRGRYGLGALLTFQEGVKRFITMNMRWFLTWRSFWFIWNQVLKVGSDLRDLFDETAYALRTATDQTASWVEQWVKSIEIQQNAIKFYARHAIELKDYLQTIYYLTTAGIKYEKAQRFANSALLTSIALREKAADVTRLLTGLYNVFGKTIRGVSSEEEAFKKIAAMLTATFKEQDIEIQDYIKALPHAAEATKLAGVNAEILIAALGVMGTHFIRSSKSGTSFTRMLMTMMKNAERYSEITGKAFDPKKPLALVPILREMAKAIRENREETGSFGVSVDLASKFFAAAGVRGQKAALTLADVYEKLAVQIEKNSAANFDLVESMAKVVEASPTKQLQILGNAFRSLLLSFITAAFNAESFSEALINVNAVVRKLSVFVRGLGEVVGMLAGRLKRLIALIATWFIWTRRMVILEKLRAAMKGLAAATALQNTSMMGFVRSAKSAGVASATLLGKLKALTVTSSLLVRRLALLSGKIVLIYTGILNLVSIFESLRRSGKETVEEAAKWAVKDVATRKKWYEKIVEFLNGANIAYWATTRQERERAKTRLAELEKEYDKELKLAEKGLKDRTQVEATYAARKLQILKDLYREVTGVEASGRTLQKLAAEAGVTDLIEIERSGAEARLEIQKWLDDEFAKIENSRLGYALWKAKQEFEEKLKVVKSGSVDELRLREWYSKKVSDLIDEYRNKALKSEKDAVAQIRRVHLTGFEKSIADAKRNTEKYNEILASAGLRLLETEARTRKIRLEKKAEEDQKFEKYWRELAGLEIKAIEVVTEALKKEPEVGAVKAFQWAIKQIDRDTPGLIQIQKRILNEMAENSRAGAQRIRQIVEDENEKIGKLIEKNLKWLEEETITTQTADIENLRKAYETRKKETEDAIKTLETIRGREARSLIRSREMLQEQLASLDSKFESRRAEIARFWERKWSQEREKALQTRYGRTKLAWVRELQGLRDFWESVLEEENKRYEERIKAYEEGTEEMKKADLDHQRFLSEVRKAEEENLKELIQNNLQLYHQYHAHLKLESLKTASSIGERLRLTFEFVSETWKAAAADFQSDSTKTAKDYVELWRGIQGDLKQLTSDWLLSVIEGNQHAESVLEDIWKRFFDSLKQRIADFLASRVWTEFLSIFKEGERQAETGRIMESWAKSFASVISEGLSKGKVPGKIAEAAEKAATESHSPSMVERVGLAIAKAAEQGLTMNLRQPLSPVERVVTTPPVVVPAPKQETSIVNVLDPNFVPRSLIKNKSVILNIISEDLISKGSSYQVLRSLT